MESSVSITQALSDRLSAHLFEVSQDLKYLDAATAAAGFVVAHMSDGSPSITDTIRLVANVSHPSMNCTKLTNISPTSYITGFTIWGLAVLGTHNSTYEPL